MKPATPIHLEFASSVPERVRSRISYAFRVFAAIYNHTLADVAGGEVLRCFYGDAAAHAGGPGVLHIPALYGENDATALPMQKRRYAGEDFYLACGVDADNGRPDWLGEIFLWLSSSHERNITSRDDIERIPYSEMIFSRRDISPRKPYAALLMAWLENVLCHGANAPEALPRAASPIAEVDHAIVSSHDIDFYFTDRASAIMRLIKNLVIAIRHYRSASFFFDNLRMLLHLLVGKRIGDYFPALLERARKYDFCSTVFVVPRHGHRRDPNYRLQNLASHLVVARGQGFSIGVHGSYCSVIEDRSLSKETDILAQCITSKPLGNRQHWLRFSRDSELFAQVEQAGLLADSTLGFPDMVGFRNGACFAFPPYNFAEEKPYNFLEIPMVLMDGNLAAASQALHADPQQLADEVLAESRKMGWGGISILWHNPIEPLSVPSEINDIFWNCASKQKQFREKWISLDQFLASCIGRYQQAGLLPDVQLTSTQPSAERVRSKPLI